MPKGHRRLLVLGLILLDILAVAIAMTAAYRAVSAVGRAPEPFGYPWPLAIVIPVAIGLLALNRLYVLDELLEGPAEYGRIAYGCTLMAFGLSVLGFWVRVEQGVPSRKLIVLVWLFSCLAVGGGRFLARRIVRALRRRGYLVSRALIVGLGSPGISLARHFGEIKHAGIQVVGFVDDFLPPGTPVTDGLKVLGPPSALPRILQQTGATEVIVVPTAMAWESFQDLIRTATDLNGHSIRLVPGLRDILATNVKVHQLGFTPLLTIERVRITGLDAILKRILDYGTAILLLPLALPLLLVMSLALAMAGIDGAARVDVVETSASTPAEELIVLEELGLDRKATGPAINPSGGPLCGNPLLVTGLVRLGEAFRQLSGRAGAHAVPGARRAIVHAAQGHCLQQNVFFVLGSERRWT